MIDFGIFLLGFLASAAIIFTAPDELLRQYLLTYSFSSAVFGLATFLLYSYASEARAIKTYPVLMMVGAALSTALVDKITVLMVVYPFLLIYSDYLATQSFGRTSVNSYRILLLVTSLPFFIWPDLFSLNLLIRTIFVGGIVTVLIFRLRSFHKISVNAPLRYLLSNYVFYNGMLILLTIQVTDTAELKIWYISMQGGLVLVLKYLDFTLRKVYQHNANLAPFVFTGSLSVLLACSYLYPNMTAAALYITGFLGLMNARRYITS